MRLVGNKLALAREFRVLSLVAVNAILDFVAEGPDESLHWPSSCITQGANSVTFNLVGKLFKHVNLSKVSISQLHALKHVDHPASALTARCALATTFVLVELGQSEDRVDYVSLVVHHDNGSGAEAGTTLLKIVEIHDCFLTLLLREHGN